MKTHEELIAKCNKIIESLDKNIQLTRKATDSVIKSHAIVAVSESIKVGK